MARLTVPVSERDHVQGSPDAPIVLVEYGDYECPHCGHAYPIVKHLQDDLGETLTFVFRNFPLSESHPHAQHAAEAAEAAGALGAFWPMHDRIFEHQAHLSDPYLVRYASDCGIAETAFLERFMRHADAGRVRQDFVSGAMSGVNGTPTFFINGVRYDGSWEYGDFLAELESRLPH